MFLRKMFLTKSFFFFKIFFGVWVVRKTSNGEKWPMTFSNSNNDPANSSNFRKRSSKDGPKTRAGGGGGGPALGSSFMEGPNIYISDLGGTMATTSSPPPPQNPYLRSSNLKNCLWFFRKGNPFYETIY
jgi:hypothetical protein